MADTAGYPIGGMTDDARIFSRMYWTDTVTGEITEGWEVTNLTTSLVAYTDMNGVAKTSGVNEIRSREPIRVSLSGGNYTVNGTASGITVDANATYAEVQPRNGVMFTVNGVDPSFAADTGFRVPSNALILLESRDELEKFSIISFIATEVHVQQYNLPPITEVVDPS